MINPANSSFYNKYGKPKTDRAERNKRTMSTYLIGFERSKGDFVDDKTGALVNYDNRSLKCVTDDGNNENNFGFSGFKVKMKMVDVARSLGVSENDSAVDTSLKNLFNKEIQLIYAPRKDEMAIVGFRPVFKKS